jgi:hypothetical protein
MYVIYDPKNSNRLARVKGNGAGVMKDAKYKSEGAAKAALTRMTKKVMQYKLEGRHVPSTYEGVENYVIASMEDYRKLDTTVERTNYMTGKTFMEDVNTPYACSPSSETYWSS